ncbi:TENA/THI-4 family protein [Fonticula alba]|uniref:TENA/THI-4 family protein n=1 Tax=Fonticula alba TaxID=691883 RepID=A0A058Z8J6_FONAL|nr:TENA/THI-4 family protein [Fonticula alba]KCV70248.1 TENA/THI-4 family protein [Fonticula alba]|eukprot:XP_009494764.1 TENA/THI-4 family protein [Fonticula alba]
MTINNNVGSSLPTTSPDMSTLFWNDIKPLFDRILSHPLITAIKNVTIDTNQLVLFVIQSRLVIADVVRALAILASRAPAIEVTVVVSNAVIAVAELKAAHDRHLGRFNIDPAALDRANYSPNALMAGSHAIRMAHERPFHEALASILPLLWVNVAVASSIQKAGLGQPASASSHQIREFCTQVIEMFSTSNLAKATTSLITLIDRIDSDGATSAISHTHQVLSIGDAANMPQMVTNSPPLFESDRLAMRRHFSQGTKCVWLLYECCINNQSWTI